MTTAHVSSVVRRTRKPTLANGTDKWFLPGVTPNVSLDVVRESPFRTECSVVYGPINIAPGELDGMNALAILGALGSLYGWRRKQEAEAKGE